MSATTTKTVEKNASRYVEAVGRRKTSVARVRITPAAKASYEVNGKNISDYFKTAETVSIAEEAAKDAGEHFKVTVKLVGGGYHSQAEAMRHGLARALVKHEVKNKEGLKKAGMLKRDPRMKERRKFGLKKARKAPQWSKR